MSTAEINSEPLLFNFGTIRSSLLQEINIKNDANSWILIFIFKISGN